MQQTKLVRNEPIVIFPSALRHTDEQVEYTASFLPLIICSFLLPLSKSTVKFLSLLAWNLHSLLTLDNVGVISLNVDIKHFCQDFLHLVGYDLMFSSSSSSGSQYLTSSECHGQVHHRVYINS